MAVLIFGFIALVVAEIYVFAQVASVLHWATLLLVIIMSAVGAWIVKREGTQTARRVADGFRAGRVPTEAVVDGFLVAVAGALFLMPGFITDVAALTITIAPVRTLARNRVIGAVQRRVTSKLAQSGPGPTFRVGGFGVYEHPADADLRTRSPHDDDVIDLDAEEVFIDLPVAEIEPPRESPK